MSSIFRHLIALPLCFSLSSCGLVVPSIEEFPDNPGDEQLLVQAIVASIHCELTNAVVNFITDDKQNQKRNAGRRNAAWFDDWGVQVALTLSVTEKSSSDATAVWTAPPAGTRNFFVGGGVSGSSEATRVNKSNFFYTVKQLYDRGKCTAGDQPASGSHSPLIQNDLRVADWLFDQMPSSGTNEAVYPNSSSGAFGQNVLSHEVKFEVVTAGGITPTWKLTRLLVNADGTLLGASRNRLSDLIVTFGPLDPKQNNKGLTSEAENVHFVQQLGLAVSNKPQANLSLF